MDNFLAELDESSSVLALDNVNRDETPPLSTFSGEETIPLISNQISSTPDDEILLLPPAINPSEDSLLVPQNAPEALNLGRDGNEVSRTSSKLGKDPLTGETDDATVGEADTLTGGNSEGVEIETRAGKRDSAGNEFDTARDLGKIGKKKAYRDFVGDDDLVDYYRFDVKKKGTVVNLQLDRLNADADLVLYDSSGEWVDSSYNEGTKPETISTPLEAGTYYIKVSPDYYSSDVNYKLTVGSRPDVGNTMKNAYNFGTLKGKRKKNFTDFVVGEWYDKSDPADYYRFKVDKWSQVKLELTGVFNEANVELLSSSGGLINSLDSVGDSTKTITETLKPDTYYVKADTNWGEAKYNLKLSSSALPENQAKINNLSFSGKEGDTGTFNIQLKRKPKSNVTLEFINGQYLTVDADNDLFTGTQDKIVFTPSDWNKPRKVSFIAELDGVKFDRKSGNTIDYAFSGGMKGGGSYNLGTVVNTYASDNKNFNIDLDFRNDYLGFWTPERQEIAQQAADDLARWIDNEHKNSHLANREIWYAASEQTKPFKVNRFVDDLVVFVNPFDHDDSIAGMGGAKNGWSKSEPLATYGTISIKSSIESDRSIYGVVSHEIQHVLGLVGKNYTGSKLVKGNYFTGAYSREFNGGKNIPVNGGHVDGRKLPDWTDKEWDELYNRLLADSGYKVYGVNAKGKPRKMSEFGKLLESSRKDDTLETARNIGNLKSKKRTFNEIVGYVDFQDYYRFRVGGKGGTLNLTLDKLSSNADVAVYDSKDNWVDSSRKPSTLSESISTFLKPGVYYANVWSPNDGKDTDYQLSLQLTPGKG